MYLKLYSLSKSILFFFLIISNSLLVTGQSNDTLNILIIGGHPDDADLCAGGSAIKWAKLGHNVKFLSLTNGDAGHHEQGGGALAKRRRAEAQESARRLGIAAYEVLDFHDGELLPSLDVRLEVIRQIRSWKADLVILPRPNDYHPDHRNTGLVVQDAAYMVIVPNVASDTPPLDKNPVFMYCQDRFQKPTPFEPHISVDIGDVFAQKVHGLDAHVSQFYEWLPWTMGRLEEVPGDPVVRKQWLAEWRQREPNTQVKENLMSWYGQDKGPEIRQAEAFELCEYGSQPTAERYQELFPMLQRPSQITTRRIHETIKVDGRLDEKVYRDIQRLELWNSLTGKAVNDEAYRTFVYIFHNTEFLYLAFDCRDQDIWAEFTERDQHLWKEEVVEVFIDTDEDHQNYFEIEVSPTNVLFDSYIVDPGNIDLVETPKFDFKQIRHAVNLDGTVKNRKDQDKRWTVEIAIPLKELVEPKEMVRSTHWKINFYRINRDQSDFKYFALRPTFGSFHKPGYFAKLTFEE